jgi:hypothetical protein
VFASLQLYPHSAQDVLSDTAFLATATRAAAAAAAAGGAAFGWARKQAPELSLAQLGKLFRQRQVGCYM